MRNALSARYFAWVHRSVAQHTLASLADLVGNRPAGLDCGIRREAFGRGASCTGLAAVQLLVRCGGFWASVHSDTLLANASVSQWPRARDNLELGRRDCSGRVGPAALGLAE
jgi:hypothetical protein